MQVFGQNVDKLERHKVYSFSGSHTYCIWINHCRNPSNRYFAEKPRCQPHCGARGTVGESTKSAGFILLGPLMPAGYLISWQSIQLFQSVKMVDGPTDSAIPRAVPQ